MYCLQPVQIMSTSVPFKAGLITVGVTSDSFTDRFISVTNGRNYRSSQLLPYLLQVVICSGSILVGADPLSLSVKTLLSSYNQVIAATTLVLQQTVISQPTLLILCSLGNLFL